MITCIGQICQGISQGPPAGTLTAFSLLPGHSAAAQAIASRNNDKGLKSVSFASVWWIELIRQGTEQDVVQVRN